MPAASRKRNKGKERKAKQLAKKEADKVEAIRVDAHRIWRQMCRNVECNHGGDVVRSDDHPVSSFVDQFFVNFHTINTGQSMCNLFQTHTQIWNNESHKKSAIGIMTQIGTNMLLQDEGGYNSWPLCIAQAIAVLEQYNSAADFTVVLYSREVISKWRDLDWNTTSSRRDLLKFFRKRTSCKCLKKMHLEARKTIPKMGFCHGCQKEYGRASQSVCSRCMIEQYCSRECQVANWPVHERLCNAYVRAYEEGLHIRES